jgi:hypothetical protein
LRPDEFFRESLHRLNVGNLRAIWEDGAERHVGLQFKGPDDLQYVFLVRRPGASFVSQVTGRDATAPIIDQLKALGLYDLVTS